MSFQILDFILAGIMLVSGILALARGFTREVLSLAAWIAAAVAAYYAIKQPQLLEVAASHISNPTIALVTVAAITFVLVLIIASIISVRISDRVVDSAAGAFDRTLGFIYGLVRGLVFVAICLIAYGAVQPPDKQEDWVRNAQSFPLVDGVGQFMLDKISYFFPGTREWLNHSNIATNPEGAVVPPAGDATAPQGYNNSQTQGLDNLVNGQTNPPANQN